jgi:regulator of sigma E protease
LGHFVVARRNGIRCYEFGFGFPPRILGVQFIKGKKRGKVREIESIEIEKTDIKTGEEEIITETISEKIHTIEKDMPVGRWRVIWGRHDGDDENEREDWDEIEENKYSGSTIYSINWIPIGGFVRIKGEDGAHKGDSDSFASKKAWARTKVLAAGVIMNFIFAWLIISIGLMIGAPEAVDQGQNVPNSKIQISAVAQNSPASVMGLKIGDEIAKIQTSVSGEKVTLKNSEDIQNYINSEKGKEINLQIIRGKQNITLHGTPRVDVPTGEGPLGISLAETQIVQYPWYQAFWKGLVLTGNLIIAILVAFYGLLRSLFMGQSVGADVTGPVGIALLTRDVTNMGLIYVIQFAALLSINLGIINILPIPALDGGRILFILIEKIKGKPVTQKVEQMFHTVFFALLILLMVLVTFHDVAKLIK